MRISEISAPELRQPTENRQSPLQGLHHQHQHLLSLIESKVKQTETQQPATPLSDSLPSELRQILTQFTQLTPLPNGSSLKLHLWKLSYRLWNACVDLSNAAAIHSQSSDFSAENVAKLRHAAADMLSLAIDVPGVPSPAIKSAFFYYKTGVIWHELRSFDLAFTCFERATEVVAKLDISEISDARERKLLLDLNIARSRTAWEVSDRTLALTLLSRSKSLLFGFSDHYIALANQYLAFAKSVLPTNETHGLNEALKLMNEALDLCEKGSSVARTREEVIEIKELRLKTLRFISAVHLQKGEFESVVKCVRVLRESCEGGDNHASLPVLAMKAWLGLGRYGEAEKELRDMVVNKGIPESVWLSAMEAYFQAAGTAGAETAKGVFLGLLGRCHVSSRAAIRVIHRMIGDGIGGEGSRIRGKAMAELVSDERVVALFDGEAASKERRTMHAILWNCASDIFRSKDYKTSAEMFEKSMLYIPNDIENRVLRAKGFRILCLCCLGMSQLDQAQEYINEAEKLEPNITCAFLKFKIYLQKSDHGSAINQIQAMTTCLDFTTEFLSLAAHEAVACRALPVAAASLSNFLNFYSSGKLMPTSEVIVLRTLVTILSQDLGNEADILKFLKRTHSRASELGSDCFFGKGEVGRREKNWFAVSSWNFGTKYGQEKNYELCAEFFKLAAGFYSFMFEGQVEENKVMICKSLILTVSAMMASEKEKNGPLTDAEVKDAVELLDRAGKMLNSDLVPVATHLSSDPISTIEPDLFFMHTLNAYDIQGRLNNAQSQELLVKSFASSKACNPKYLLQIGLRASEGPHSNPEVAAFALNECLSALLSSSSPDYQDIALIIRRLIAIASIHKGDRDDDAVIDMYKQAYRMMVGLKEGEFPTEEGKWLAMTAWNRAALPVRLGQIDVAKKWMNAGLEIARKIVGMETYRSCMEDFVSSFEEKFNVQNTGQSKTPLVQ